MANLLPLLLAYIVYGWSPTYFLNGPLWKIHFLSIIPKVSEHWVILYYLRFWQFLSLQTCIHNFSGQIYVHLVLHRNSVRNRISIWKKNTWELEVISQFHFPKTLTNFTQLHTFNSIREKKSKSLLPMQKCSLLSSLYPWDILFCKVCNPRGICYQVICLVGISYNKNVVYLHSYYSRWI